MTTWHDILHLPLSITEPDGLTWSYEYNEQGSIQSILAPSIAQFFYAYNEHGLLRMTANESLFRNEYIYNELNQLKEYIGIDYNKYRFVYHSDGNLYKFFDEKSRSLSFNFTKGNRLESITLADGSVRHFEYNEKGQVININTFD